MLHAHCPVGPGKALQELAGQPVLHNAALQSITKHDVAADNRRGCTLRCAIGRTPADHSCPVHRWPDRLMSLAACFVIENQACNM